MRDLIDLLLPSVSGTVATMNMASKPLLGFARAEGGGFEVAVVTFECNPIGQLLCLYTTNWHGSVLRQYKPLFLSRLSSNLLLTVLYLVDRSRIMDLLCGLTGSLVLTVLYLADRSKTMDL